MLFVLKNISLGGETVKQLQSESGAKIYIDAPNLATRTRAVHIRGNPQVLQIAKQLIDVKLGEWEARNHKQGLGPRLSLYTYNPGASTNNNSHCTFIFFS